MINNPLTWSQLGIQLLKYLAIAVSTASGVWATFFETKDPVTKKLTPQGRNIFGCLVVSSVVALLSQGLETQDAIVKARDAEKARDRQDVQFQAILSAALAAGTSATFATSHASQAERSALSAVESLTLLSASQRESLEHLWRLQHQFGHWEGKVTATLHLPNTPVFVDWQQRLVKARPSREYSLVILPGETLYPDEKTLRPFLASFVLVAFDRNPRRTANGELALLGDNGDLALALNMDSTVLKVTYDRDGAVASVNAEVTYRVRTQSTNNQLNNWIDLYGSEVSVTVPFGVTKGDRLIIELSYTGPIENNQIYIRQTIGENSSVSFVLGEKDLGTFPSDYLEMFPDFQASRRITALRRTSRLERDSH